MQEELATARLLLDLAPRLIQMVRRESLGAGGAAGLAAYRVLVNLERGPMAPGELASRMGVSAPAVSRLCAGLARRGLLRSEAPAAGADRRGRLLSLKPAGLLEARKMKAEVVRRLSRRLQELGEGRRRRLDRALRSLEEALR